MNAEVIGHIRNANPFAHSDLGQRLIDLQKRLGLGAIYCPSFASCAFVLLHDQANTVFAFAGGMRDISFLLPPVLRDEIQRDGLAQASSIGPSWVDIAAFTGDATARLETCCTAAFAYSAIRTARSDNDSAR